MHLLLSVWLAWGVGFRVLGTLTGGMNTFQWLLDPIASDCIMQMRPFPPPMMCLDPHSHFSPSLYPVHQVFCIWCCSGICQADEGRVRTRVRTAATNAKNRCVPTEFMSQHALCVVNGACTALIGWARRIPRRCLPSFSPGARRIPRRGLPSFSPCAELEAGVSPIIEITLQ